MPRFQVVVTCLLIFTPVARAHLGSSKFLRVEVAESTVQIDADLDAVDVAYALEQPYEEPDPATLLASRADIERWLGGALRVTAGGDRCAMRLERVAMTERDGRPFVSLGLRYACPRGDGLVLTDDAVFDDDARHQSFVRLGGTDQEAAEVLSQGRRSLAIGGPPPSGLDVAGTFLVEGMIHLVTGFDHLLFLLSLVLVAGHRAHHEGLRRALREIAFIVTGFTLGHSVTLIASALDWVTLPSRWVEVAIALSIAVVAIDNIARPSPDRRDVLPAIAVIFGLVHGFGFASVLRELSLPRVERLVPLLSFNVGIELAQLAFVAVLLVPLGWLAQRAWYRAIVVRGGSAVIVVIALYWAVERALAV